MKESLIIGIITIFSWFGLTGCGPDGTKELIVFEENIGMPDDILGKYELENTEHNQKVNLYIYYNNSKYYLFYFSNQSFNNGKGNFIFSGSFVPSQVNGTKDYYIMSYPKTVMENYNIKKGYKSVQSITDKKILLFFKKESDNLMIWYDMLSDSEEGLTGSAIKQAIKDSYKKTFTKEAMIFKLVSESKGLEGDIERIKKQIKEKYKDYITKEEYDRLEKERQKKKIKEEKEDKKEKEKYNCDIKDDYESCQKMGYRYLKGDGVGKDSSKTKKYFRLSCKYSKDKGKWCSSIGQSYYYANNGFERNYKESLYYFKQGCDEGSVDACRYLGWQYKNSEGTDKDMGKAFDAFKKSCEGDDTLGCYSLAYRYLNGEGTYKNRDKASKYFKKSCNLGDTDGCSMHKGLQKETEKCGSQMTDKINSFINKGNIQEQSAITIFNGADIKLNVYSNIKTVLRQCYQATYDKDVEKLIIKTNKKIDTMNEYYRLVIQNGENVAESKDIASGFFNVAIGVSSGRKYYDKANKYKVEVTKLIQKVVNKTPY